MERVIREHLDRASEVERMHQSRREINEMTPEAAAELIRGLGDDAAEDWVLLGKGVGA
jgi:hypothetical protein